MQTSIAILSNGAYEVSAYFVDDGLGYGKDAAGVLNHEQLSDERCDVRLH